MADTERTVKIEELEMYVEVDVRKTLPDTPTPVGGVTGVKGSAETQYRTGNVNISPENIGLGNVDNTSDLAKPISTAVQGELDRIDGEIDDIDGELGTLDEKIEAETTARETAISAEQQAREDEDTAINANIQTLSDGLQEAEQDIQELQNDIDQVEQSITAEESRAKGVEEDLSDEIDTINGVIPDGATPQNPLTTESRVQEIAGGATANYVVSNVTNPVFNSTAYTITVSGTITDINGNVVQVSNLKAGANIYVVEVSVPDRWVGEVTGSTATLYQLETAKVPVTDVQRNGTSIVDETVVNLLVDSTPTANSTNFITSGAVKTAVDSKVSDVKNGDGTSLVNAQTKVATIPDASTSTKGLAKVGAGLKATNGAVSTDGATASEIATGTDGNKPLTPSVEMIATKKSLGVAVGSSTSNTAWTEAEKTTARGTLGVPADADLSTVAKTGNYNDLSNKPTIPTNVVKYTAQTLTEEQQTQARTNINCTLVEEYDGWDKV